ncbi:hypothetical protein [Prescottella agglutinans]|uniref:hypothetical protein n=1 Tax=Prescottella agglutinans TaxID=1644129 RepID=UPI000FDE1018|nr:hypothetical protein [Prescottella agglutinans]
MKRSIIVALAGATIALGTAASASAAPVDLENPALPVASAGSSGSSDFFYPHDGQNSGSTNLSNGVATASLNVLCTVFLGGKTLADCIPDDL